MYNRDLQLLINKAHSGVDDPNSMRCSLLMSSIATLSKRMVERRLLLGNRFDSVVMGEHEFENYLKTTQLSLIDQQLIFSRFQFTTDCTYLFPNNSVSLEEINHIKAMHECGLIHVLAEPGTKIYGLMYAGYEPGPDLNRSELINTPTLINTLNVVHDTKFTTCHFLERTPQFRRYVEAVEAAKLDAKSMRFSHEVYFLLIHIDQLCEIIKSKIKLAIDGSLETIEWLDEGFKSIEIVNLLSLEEEYKIPALQLMPFNFIANYIFQVSKLKKEERFEFLEVCCSAEYSIIKKLEYLFERNLINL